jgi:hypothetical protein
MVLKMKKLPYLAKTKIDVTEFPDPDPLFDIRANLPHKI